MNKIFEDFTKRQVCVKPGRTHFFKFAVKYLGASSDSIVVDIGTGNGDFLRDTKLHEKYKHTYLLDGNEETVMKLSQDFPSTKVVEYLLPERMPFNDASVSFIHMSHIIEHINPEQLYKTLKEIDRVLKPGGQIAISTPLMWDRFWDDLSHVRPYSPSVLRNYLVKGRDNATGSIVSTDYEELDFTYRYRSVELISSTSRYFVMYVLMKILNYVLLKLGFRRYIKNGYTIILQKN